MSLANKYRPKEFNEVLSQDIIIKILEKQLETNQYPNVYGFCGSSGTGKSTLARILANKINKGLGNPLEIDAASNNGVDNIRNIIADAKERSLYSEYKIIILDEAHMLTTQSWNALLKCLEEPPKYTIFIFCTTDPQKIPVTIQSRMMRFNLTPIDSANIEKRLNYICQQENFFNYEESTSYISKIVDGSMRKAISYIEKISNYNNDLSLTNTLNVLGDCSYNYMFKLINSIIDKNDSELITTLNTIYKNGNDLKLFMDQYLDFILDLSKYCITENIDSTKIPKLYLKQLQYTTSIENNIDYFKWLLDKIIDLKELIKYDSNINTTIYVKLLQLTRS